MQPVLTPKQMYALERAYFARGASSLALMERAAMGVAQTLDSHLTGVSGKTICVACGRGNNGGDGYAAARLLRALGAQVWIWASCEESSMKGDALTNRLRAQNAGVPLTPRLEEIPVPDIWVDALFGIGLNRAIEGECLDAVRRIADDRAKGALVLAVDLPSGIQGETGNATGTAVHADITITFEYLKTGHVLNDGPDYCGRIAVWPLGIPLFTDPTTAHMPDPQDLAPVFAPRRRNTHKGTYGHLLIVAGSVGMAGAAVLAASAAVRSGAGLVSVACPEELLPILQIQVPEAICLPLPASDGALSEAAVPVLARALSRKQAVVIGPGLSGRAHPLLVRCILECGLPALFDADALNLIAENPPLMTLFSAVHAVTPHPGEAARLLGRPVSNPLRDAWALHQLGPIALLKGAASVIQGENTTLIASGSPGMARGGSGDVLSGMTGALMARGLTPENALIYAAQWHGLAGSLAAESLTEICMTARDLIAHLPDVARVYRQN